jgi:hypothetical protein
MGHTRLHPFCNWSDMVHWTAASGASIHLLDDYLDNNRPWDFHLGGKLDQRRVFTLKAAKV